MDYSLEKLLNSLSKVRKNKKVVLMGGCFDILHVGHLAALHDAKKLGDVLVVGVDTDDYVSKRKGNHRPIIPGRFRAMLVEGLKPVDCVFLTSIKLYDRSNIAKIKPDILVLRNEKDRVAERKLRVSDLKKEFGFLEVVFQGRKFDTSTTKIERRIFSGYLKHIMRSYKNTEESQI